MTTHSSTEGNPYFRLKGQQIGASFCCFCGVVFFLNAFRSSVGKPMDMAISGISVLVSAILIVRSARVGAVARPEALVVRNTLRTVTVPWEKIEEFGYGRLGLTGSPVVVARLRKGRAVPLAAFLMVYPTPPALRITGKVIDRLNQELAARSQ